MVTESARGNLYLAENRAQEAIEKIKSKQPLTTKDCDRLRELLAAYDKVNLVNPLVTLTYRLIVTDALAK